MNLSANYHLILAGLLLMLGLTGCSSVASDESRAREQLLFMMESQEKCWNEGNIECFMEGYWPSDSLMFIGKDGITYGYDNTLERYKKNYPDRAAMGKLDFEIISLERLSPEAYHMVGKWQLEREQDDLGGHFTLVFKKMDGQWYIVKDHSS